MTPFVDADPERLAAMIAGDVTAPVLLTAAFVPQLLSAVNGFIINVASVSAYFPHQEWLYTVPQKAFVLSFSESLWMELRGTSLTAFAVCPGATRTEFTTGMGPEASVLTSGRMRTPEDVAVCIPPEALNACQTHQTRQRGPSHRQPPPDLQKFASEVVPAQREAAAVERGHRRTGECP